MTSNLINITSKTPQSIYPATGLILNYEFNTITKPVFYNSDSSQYSNLKPVINQVFNSEEQLPISNFDYMTYLFPNGNTIQFSNGTNQLSTYYTKFIHFTSGCPVKQTIDASFSLIIECSSDSINPLLIIIPIKTSTATSNGELDNLIRYSQTNPDSVSQTNILNIYLNNIIPSKQQFLYFNQPTISDDYPSSTINSCEIVIFPTPIFTSYSQSTYNTNRLDWDSIVNITSLRQPASVINYKIANSDMVVYKSPNYASNTPVINENDIYIDCSVVEDSTTIKTRYTKPKKPKNTGLFIILIIVIFVSSVIIYMWIFNSGTVIRSGKPLTNTTANTT
jgi:hypothetical protein